MPQSATAFATVAVCAAVTLLTRALPFLIFAKRRPPKIVTDVGTLLPGAVVAVLTVYCLKDLNFGLPREAAVTLVCVAAVVLLHLRKRNVLLSVGGGTLLYILLIRLFPM